MPKAKKHVTVFVFQLSHLTFEVQAETEEQIRELKVFANAGGLQEVNTLNLESGTWIIYRP